MWMHRLKTACVYWVEDQASQMGAALAYYTLFSLTPLLLLALTLAGQAFGEAEAKAQVMEALREFSGAEGATAVQTMLENAQRMPAGTWPTAVLGIGSLVFGALGMFTQLRASLSRIWRLSDPPAQHFLIGFIKNYLLAFLMVLVCCLFVLTLLTVSTVLATVQIWWHDLLPGAVWTWPLMDLLASTLLITLLFGFTFRFMSDGRVCYRYVWGGAIVSALLFCVGKQLISWYLGYARVSTMYGAAGSLVVFLVWVYYSAQIFFFGAEIIRVRLQEVR